MILFNLLSDRYLVRVNCTYNFVLEQLMMDCSNGHKSRISSFNVVRVNVMKILLFSIQLESTANRPIDVSTTVSVRESPTISVGSVEKSGKFYFIELPIHLCALAF